VSRERGGIGSGSEIEKRVNKHMAKTRKIFNVLMTPPIMIYRQPGISDARYAVQVYAKAIQIANALGRKK